MKKQIKRACAALLAAVMLIALCGCSALDLAFGIADVILNYDSYYEDYDSYYNDYESYYGDYYDNYGDDYNYDYSSDDYFGLLYDYFGSDEYYNDYYSDYSNYGETENAGLSSGVLVVANNPESKSLRTQWTKLKGNGNDTVTVMVYLCAADLESESGLASTDLKEMMSATQSDKIRIIVECGGTTKWHTAGISAGKNTRILIENGSYSVLESNSRRSMVDPNTLEDFINFCTTNYPADRNMLILWDHGAGSVDGWGYDEYYSQYSGDTLTIDELQDALHASGAKFDFIGFDACLMSTMETACVLYDYADYMIASEDYESGYGWEYQYWLTALAENSSMPTTELAKIICDDYIEESGSESAILACVDLSYMISVYAAWRDFAYASEDQLLSSEFSWETENTSRRSSRSYVDSILDMLYSEAEINDMLAISSAVENVEQSEALAAALNGAIIYAAANSGDAHMTGLSVALPYGDSSAYNNIERIFANVGFEDTYIDWLEGFTDVNSSSEYDWYDYYSDWSGYDSYDYSDYDDYFDSYFNDYYDYGYGDDYGYDDYGNDYSYGGWW